MADVVGRLQEVADSVSALLDLAVFPSRIHADADDEAFPEHARYLLAFKSLCDELGLTVERAAATQEKQ